MHLRFPDDSGLSPGGYTSPVGKKERRGAGTKVNAEDLPSRDSGSHELVAGELPEVDAAGGWVPITAEHGVPGGGKIAKLALAWAKAWPAHRQDIAGIKTVGSTKGPHSMARKVGRIAPPAAMQGSDIAALGVGEEDGLAVGGPDNQGSVAGVGIQPIALAVASLHIVLAVVGKHVAAVDLLQLVPAHKTEMFFDGNAVGQHMGWVVAYVEGQVGFPKGASALPAEAGGEDAVDVGKAWKVEIKDYRIHGVRVMVWVGVMRMRTATSQGSRGSIGTTWKSYARAMLQVSGEDAKKRS